MEKRDPYNSKEKWDNWISKPSIPGTLKINEKLIIDFLKDFDLGKNISKSSKKGERSPIRLMALKSRLCFFAKQFKRKDFLKLSKDDMHRLFKDMREGKITKANGRPYKSTGSYVKDWKTFWNWLLKVGKIKEDINEDLDRTDTKPAWVYLDDEQFKKLANQCSPDYRPLVWLMLDAGCRVTEAYSIKVSDFSEDYKKLTIREETSKNNYERTINLKLCSALIKDYVDFYDLKADDFLFQKKPPAFNKYIKEKCIKLFGEGVSHPKAKGRFSEFSLYSIRHIASCYWLKRYSTHRALMYRMAWTSERFIRYYSEFLGQNDELSDEDMLTEEDKGKVVTLEKRIEELEGFYKQYDTMAENIIDKRDKENALLKKKLDVFKKALEEQTSSFSEKLKKFENALTSLKAS
jgi:integrase